MSIRTFSSQITFLSRKHQCNRNFVRFRKRTIAPEVLEKHLNSELNPTLTSKLTMVSQQEGDHVYITKYSGLGFSLNSGIKLAGPTLFFPRHCLKWKVNKLSDINEQSLHLFSILTPKLDLLIIGTGRRKQELDPDTIRFLRKNDITFEVFSSEQAIPAFNFQNNDQCWIAAAILPPERGSSRLIRDVQKIYSKKLDATDMVLKDERELPKIESTQDEDRKTLQDSSDKGDEKGEELISEKNLSKEIDRTVESKYSAPPLGQGLDFMSSASVGRVFKSYTEKETESENISSSSSNEIKQNGTDEKNSNQSSRNDSTDSKKK